MPFDKKEYKEYKSFVESNINDYGHSPTCYSELLPLLIKEENYEACKAIVDVLKEWSYTNTK